MPNEDRLVQGTLHYVAQWEARGDAYSLTCVYRSGTRVRFQASAYAGLLAVLAQAATLGSLRAWMAAQAIQPVDFAAYVRPAYLRGLGDSPRQATDYLQIDDVEIDADPPPPREPEPPSDVAQLDIDGALESLE